MRINYSDESNYNKACVRLIFLTWLCIALIALAETFTVFIDAHYLGNTVLAGNFKSFVFMPATINVLVMAIVHIVSYILLKHKFYIGQACIYIVGLTVICVVMARLNQSVNISLLFFIIPIMLALLYLDIRILVFSLVSSLAAMGLHTMYLLRNTNRELNETFLPVNIETSIVIIAIAFVIGFMVIKRVESLHTAATEALQKGQEDMLTGYLNHSGFYDDLDEVFKNVSREKGEFCLSLIDIDNFTLINEEYGYSVGDEIIEIMVDCINKSLVNTAKAYRYGGEEFVIICRGHQEIVINMVDSMIREFKNKTEMITGVLVTASAGICEYDPHHFKGKRDIFAALDEALYAAKRMGKDQYCVWNEALVRDSYVSSGKILLQDEDISRVAE